MFSEKLRILRKEKGITQEELAEMLEVSRQAISKYESGNGYPDVERLLLIAQLFGVSTDFLLGLETESRKGYEKGTLPEEKVFDIVAMHMGIRKEDIRSKRDKACVEARGIVVYVLRDYMHMSLQDIGDALGKKNHTACIFLYRDIEEKIRQDSELRFKVNLILADLGLFFIQNVR